MTDNLFGNPVKCMACTPIPNFHNGCNPFICPCKCHRSSTT